MTVRLMWKFTTFTHMVLFIMFILYENTFLGCMATRSYGTCSKLSDLTDIWIWKLIFHLWYSPISFELCKVGQKTFCWKGFDHSERKGPKLKHEWITLIRWNELCAHAIKCGLSSPICIEKHQQVWWIVKWIVSENTDDMT